MSETFFTTAEIAKRKGVVPMTLHLWLWRKLVSPPAQRLREGKNFVWLWTQADLERVLAFKAPGQGRRPRRRARRKGN